MKKKYIIICLIVISVFVLSSCSNSKELIGKWEEQNLATNTKGEAIFNGHVFNEDGTLQTYNGAGELLNIMNYTWKENGKNSFVGDGDGGKFPMKYLIEGDTLYLDYEQNVSNNSDLKERGKQFKKVDDFSFSDLVRRDSLQSNMTAEQVANALKNAGLPIGEIFVYTEENDSSHLIGRPHQYTSQTDFSDTNVKQDTYTGAKPSGGRIKVFATIADAQSDFRERQSYGAVYIYKAGNVVLSLDTEVLPANALLYQEAFYKVVQ